VRTDNPWSSRPWLYVQIEVDTIDSGRDHASPLVDRVDHLAPSNRFSAFSGRFIRGPLRD
jgi:hypothetical protein